MGSPYGFVKAFLSTEGTIKKLKRQFKKLSIVLRGKGLTPTISKTDFIKINTFSFSDKYLDFSRRNSKSVKLLTAFQKRSFSFCAQSSTTNSANRNSQIQYI